MDANKIKRFTHAVLKLSDVLTAISKRESLGDAFNELMRGHEEAKRERGANANPTYFVINTDEPYANEIVDVLRRNKHWDDEVPVLCQIDDEIMWYKLPDGTVVERTKNGNLYYTQLKPYIGQEALLLVEHSEKSVNEGIRYTERIHLVAIHQDRDEPDRLHWNFIDEGDKN